MRLVTWLTCALSVLKQIAARTSERFGVRVDVGQLLARFAPSWRSSLTKASANLNQISVVMLSWRREVWDVYGPGGRGAKTTAKRNLGSTLVRELVVVRIVLVARDRSIVLFSRKKSLGLVRKRYVTIPPALALCLRSCYFSLLRLKKIQLQYLLLPYQMSVP